MPPTERDTSSMLLKGKTLGSRAEITGSALRRHGGSLPKARVAITGRDGATLATAADELGVTAIKSDILDTHARTNLFDRIKHEFGHLDILFANAGIACGRSWLRSGTATTPTR